MLSEFPPIPDAARGEVVPARFHQLRTQENWLAENRLTAWFPTLAAHLGLRRATRRRAEEIIGALRAFHPQVLVGCTASPLDVPATALAAKALGVPFVAYLFDDPVFQWAPGPLRDYAAWAEPRWSRRAAAIVVPNEFVARDFAARTGLQPVVIRNPVAEAAFLPAARPPGFAAEASTGPLSILYTGSVYHAQADAFVNMMRALEEFDGRLVLDIYTNQSAMQVASYGIAGPLVRVHDHVAQHQSYALQQAADVLFLPLAFHSSIPEVLNSSAPAKLGEFLASRRPLLAHAPASGFLVDHLRRHDAAFVVDQPAPGLLADALREILAGGEAVARRVENAFRLASLYRAASARSAFWSLLTSVAGGYRVKPRDCGARLPTPRDSRAAALPAAGPARPAAPSPAEPDKMGAIFTQVYDSGIWGQEGSLSGPGSDLTQTEVLRTGLPALIRQLGVRTMLDIPCGDWFWMRHCELSVERYIGADVVPWLVEGHNKAFGGPGREFRVLDLVRDQLPAVDLIFCRDCLVHFSDQDVRLALANIRRSGARWLATTTFTDRLNHQSIATGDWRPMNLSAAPFNLPPPVALLNEGCTEADNQFTDKCLAIWPVSVL